MTTLTKKQAHLLAAHDYRLVDNAGNEIEIILIDNFSRFSVKSINRSDDYRIISLNEIGKDYFIIARDYSQLTQEIEHEGKRFIAIIEMAKMSTKAHKEDWYIQNDGCTNEYSGYEFWYDENANDFCLLYNEEWERTENQYELFDLLHTWHFQPVGIPKEFIKPIVDTKN